MKTINYGLIGCGMMGQEHIRNIALIEGVAVSVVHDPVAELAQKASALAGGAAIAGSLDDLLKHDRLDALVIASPNYLHAEQLQKILSHRALPVLCEKPLYVTEPEAAIISELTVRHAGPVWVAMEYRYMPPIAALIEEAPGLTGGVNMLSIREHRYPFLEKVGDWNRFNANTGGTLVEKCCHFFDLMRLIIGAEPVCVMASAGQAFNHKDEHYDGRVPDIWDSGYVLFDFDNGARAMLELCMFADGSLWNEEISAVGPAGKIECRVPGPQRFWPEGALGQQPHAQLTRSPRHPIRPQTREIATDPALIEAGDHQGATFFQHRKFAEMVRAGGQPEVSLNDGAKAVEMAMAAQRSATQRQVVFFQEDTYSAGPALLNPAAGA